MDEIIERITIPVTSDRVAVANAIESRPVNDFHETIPPRIMAMPTVLPMIGGPCAGSAHPGCEPAALASTSGVVVEILCPDVYALLQCST